MRSARLIFNLVFGMLASLAPLFFLVSLIAAFDRYGAHQQLLSNLADYGYETQGTLSYVDFDSGRAGVDYLNSAGEVRYGVLRLEYYPAEMTASMQPGQQVQIRTIDALVSGYEQTVLVQGYPLVREFFPITADVLVMMAIAWLVVMFKPQFVFLGLLDFETLMGEALQ